VSHSTHKLKPEVRLYLPAGLNQNELSTILTGAPGNYSASKKVCLLYSYLISRGFNQEKATDFGANWTQVNSKVLRVIFGGSYNKWVNLLLKSKYLERLNEDPKTGKVSTRGFYRTPQNRDGGQSKQYRIPAWLLSNKGGLNFTISNQSLGKTELKKLHALRAPKRSYARDQYRQHIEKMMQELILVDTPDSRRAIANLQLQKALQGTPEQFLEVFNHGAMNEVLVDEFGWRVHSKITNTSKHLRPFLRFANDQLSALVEIDFATSQPSILASLTPDLIRQFAPDCAEAIPLLEALQNEPSFQKFQHYCLEEDIYAYLASRWNATYPEEPLTRTQAKNIFFRAAYSNYQYLGRLDVIKLNAKARSFAASGSLSAAMQEAASRNAKSLRAVRSYHLFKSEFVAVHDFFAALKQLEWSSFNPSKRGCHTNNCLLAQRIESGLIYECLVKAVMEAGISQVVTIHDSLLVREADEPRVRAIIECELASLGVRLRLGPSKLGQGEVV